jgi:hypothetical protein
MSEVPLYTLTSRVRGVEDLGLNGGARGAASLCVGTPRLDHCSTPTIARRRKRVGGFRFRVKGLCFRVWGFGFRVFVCGLDSRVWDSGFGVWVFGFRF